MLLSQHLVCLHSKIPGTPVPNCQHAVKFCTSQPKQAECMQGLPGELRALAPCIQELDLADNLLPSWTEAARLAQELPELASLDLSLNRMAWPLARPAPDAVAPFMRLETLVLNQCCLSWHEVTSCGMCCTWPALS